MSVEEYYPLSSAQMRVFLLNQLNSTSKAFNLTRALYINGNIDICRLEQLLKKLVDRHEALRTSFCIIDGNPVQKIHNNVDVVVDYQECDDNKDTIDNLIKDFIKPYDIFKLPLFRFKILRLNRCNGEPSFIFIQDMHRIISDGVSEGILIDEINQLYSGQTLSDIKMQYKEYVDWQNRFFDSKEINLQKEYWLKKLVPELPVLDLPTDYTRPQLFSFEGKTVNFQIGKDITSELNNFARKNNCKLFAILLAGYSILLSRYTKQSDIIIGTLSEGRMHSDIKNTMGIFNNPLALRISCNPEFDINEFLQNLEHELLQAFDNQDYPFENIVNDLQLKIDQSRNPVFNSMFVFQNTNINTNTNRICNDNFEISNYDFEKGLALYDLTVIAKEIEDDISIQINYCESLFREDTIKRIGSYFISILEYMTKCPNSKLCEFDIVSDNKNIKLSEYIDIKKIESYFLKGSIIEKKQTSDSFELPIYFPPAVKTYLPLSILSSVIMVHDPENTWLHNNFIQLYQKPLSNRIEFYPNQDFHYADQSLLNVTSLSSLNFRMKKEEFIDNIIFWIDNKNYVIVYVSESEVPGTRYYKKMQILHSEFIFGYDLTKRIFKVLNYTKANEITIVDVSFDDIYNAFYSEVTANLYKLDKLNWTFKNKKFRIELLRYKDNSDPSYVNRIDLDVINKKIYDYVYSKNSSLNNNYFTSIQEGSWGISIYKNILACIEKNKGLKLDFRMFQLLYEHKALMVLRFEKLKSEFNIEVDFEGLIELYNIANEMRYLGMKYMVSQDILTADKMINLLNKLYEKECKILSSYLEKYYLN